MADYPYDAGGEVKMNGAATTAHDVAISGGGFYSPMGGAISRIVRSTAVQVNYSRYFFKDRRRRINI